MATVEKTITEKAARLEELNKTLASYLDLVKERNELAEEMREWVRGLGLNVNVDAKADKTTERKSSKPADDIRAAIMDKLANGQPHKFSGKFAEQVGGTKQAFYKVRDELVNTGAIVKDGQATATTYTLATKRKGKVA
jgi:hypothetical protein